MPNGLLLPHERVPEPSPREQEAGILQARQGQVMGIRATQRGDRPANILFPAKADPAYIESLRNAAGVPSFGERMEQFTLGNAVDFIFGGEMAVMGIEQDVNGWSWSWQNMQQQWSEEPLWINLLNTASLGATFVYPMAKVGLRAAGVTQKVAYTLDDFKRIGLADEAETSISKSLHRKLTNDLRAKENYARGKQIDDQIAEGLRPIPTAFGTPQQWLSHKWREWFANDYMKITGLIGDEALTTTHYYRTVDELARAENFGRFFDEMPVEGDKLFQHFLHRVDNSIAAPKLTQAEQKWANAYWDYARQTQKAMFDEALIDEATFKRIGEAHIPALLKETPPPVAGLQRAVFLPLKKRGRKGIEDEIEHLVISKYDVPKLDWDTLKARKADMPEIFQRLRDGKLITDPAELTIRGLITDQMILNNFRFIRDLAISPQARKHADLMMTFGNDAKKASRAGWVQLDQGLPPHVTTRLRNMIEKKGGLAGDEKMPWVRKEVFNELFGRDGIFAQSVHQIGAFELLSAVHKTAKTVLNVPTQIINMVGNGVFLGMRGFNVYSPENLNILGESSRAFWKIANTYNSRKQAGVAMKEILADPKGLKLGKIKIGDKTLDLAEELLDPQVRDLIEESALEYAEGFAHLERLTSGLKKGNATRVLAEITKGTKKLAQFGDRFKWTDYLSKMYLAGDMVPKTAYYLSLRAKGLTKEGAVLEVGRALPMYSTVGAKIRSGRRWIWPWLSFPVEAARIMKNNIQDYPIRAGAVLHLPQIMQTMFGMSGAGPTSPEELEAAKKSLPLWAQKHTTLVGSEPAQRAMGAGLTGLVTGGIAGAVRGGARGALLGGAAGVAGYMGLAEGMKHLGPDNTNEIRGAVLDWLPHSSFLPQTISPEAGTFMGLPGQTFDEALQNLPVQPFSILMPLLNITTGRTPFGEEIGATSHFDQLRRGFMGFMEWLSPPMFSKYLFKSYGPTTGLISQGVGLGLPGLESIEPTNITRGLIDTGIAIDPNTGKPGSPSMDGFLNNFSFWKSYAASPTQRLINEGRTERELSKVRTAMSRDLSFHLENGHDPETTQILEAVMSTFTRQYIDDPKKAQEKYADWLKRRTRDVGRHPRLRGWSQEELIARMEKANEFAGGERSRVRDMLKRAINEQLLIREAARQQAGVPGTTVGPATVGPTGVGPATVGPGVF